MKQAWNKKWVRVGIIALGVVIIAWGGITLARQSQGGAAQGSAYQTEVLSRGNLVAYVGATGTVRSNQSAVLSWQTNGIVGTLKAAKGEQVTAGAELATLKQTSLSQNIILAQADLVNAQKQLDEVMTSTEARATAELNLVKAQQAVEDAEEERQSKQYQRASQNTIDIAHANLIMADQALDDAEVIFEQNRLRSQDDPVYAAALSQLASARQNHDKAYYNYQYVQGLPSTLDIAEADANLDVANAQLLEAKREWERVKDGPNEQDVAAAQARVAAAQAALDLAHITAPFSGTITAADSLVGDLVTPGARAFQIDDLSHLYIDLAVSEVDINAVQIDQPVSVTFDAIANQEFTGVVTDVSAVGQSSSGTVDFLVTVELLDPSATVKPGMTAAANIAVAQLEDTLLVPNRAIRTQDGKRLVYVMQDGSLQAVEIELGASSGTVSEILSGNLKAGDRIVLNPPSTTLLNPSGANSIMRGG
ncbi:MAG: efflux RND transporter periplasmic adaptor subunit [Chloroflexi bacterium]|nr:efflux RND transporter periplasmic adaptor subunit [Chloroflexota bacterium]